MAKVPEKFTFRSRNHRTLLAPEFLTMEVLYQLS
jgi:hypothetical protein